MAGFRDRKAVGENREYVKLHAGAAWLILKTATFYVNMIGSKKHLLREVTSCTGCL